MDRLSFVGNRGMGALSYLPVSDLYNKDDSQALSVSILGLQAQALFDGQTTEVLQALVNAGNSGGARPKAQLYLKDSDPDYCSTRAGNGAEACLVKFTSSQLALGHEEGICEASYLSMAKLAGIEVPQWKLLDAPNNSGATKWLALKRFDVTLNKDGKEGYTCTVPVAFLMQIIECQAWIMKS